MVKFAPYWTRRAEDGQGGRRAGLQDRSRGSAVFAVSSCVTGCLPRVETLVCVGQHADEAVPVQLGPGNATGRRAKGGRFV
jgi:hypothetical protein